MCIIKIPRFMIATSFLQAVINSRPRRYGAIKIINVNIFGLSAYGLMECLIYDVQGVTRKLVTFDRDCTRGEKFSRRFAKDEFSD